MTSIIELFNAVKAGDLENTRRLLSLSPDLLQANTPFGSLLHVAASHGHKEISAYLLSIGADVNAIGGTFKGTPVNVAASNGYAAIVMDLLAAGATLDCSEPERNPLFGAIYGGHLDVVQALVSAGIDHKLRYTGTNMQNMSAADFASERGQLHIRQYLDGLA